MIKISDLKENAELIIVIFFVCLSMGGYYFYIYREYSKTKNTFEQKRHTGICPDYWSITEDSNPDSEKPLIKCRNDKKIGRCNYTEPQDFSSELYKDDIAKCKWSKYCNAPWEGIDNLCSDLTKQQL
jgi:hypothetical protein